VITRVIRRKTNRRHMTGDHHDRAAGTATLLLTTLDGILGTHRTGAVPPEVASAPVPSGPHVCAHG
jgi:hypothetical protein